MASSTSALVCDIQFLLASRLLLLLLITGQFFRTELHRDCIDTDDFWQIYSCLIIDKLLSFRLSYNLVLFLFKQLWRDHIRIEVCVVNVLHNIIYLLY